MFTIKCDLCSSLQTEEDASKLTGTAITMNGMTRHACGTCMEILRTAFAVGKEGVQDPMKALAKVTSERDQLFRLSQARDQVQRGDFLSLEEISQAQRRYKLGNPLESPAPRLAGPGSARTQKTHALQGPKKHAKKR